MPYPKDIIWDAMSRPGDVEVEEVKSDDTGATYRVSLNITFTKWQHEKIRQLAIYKQRKLPKLIREFVRFGLKTFMAEDTTAASGGKANGASSNTRPPSYGGRPTSDAATLPATFYNQGRESHHG